MRLSREKRLEKKRIIIHEAGHLLFTLKYIYIPSNIEEIEYIHVCRDYGVFQHGDFLMPDDFHLCRVLGGAAAEIAYNNIPYRKLTFLYSCFFTGWDEDIKQGLEHGYSWKDLKSRMWKLAKEITNEDKCFLEEVVMLFKGNTKTLKMDKLIPVIKKYYPNIILHQAL